MLTTEAGKGRATAPGIAFVAGLVGVVEIRTAGPLQQIAGGRCLVAQLARGTGKQRSRQQAVITSNALVRCQISIGHKRANPESAFRCRFDSVQPHTVHVDQMERHLYLKLHQIQKVRASRDELCARLA